MNEEVLEKVGKMEERRGFVVVFFCFLFVCFLACSVCFLNFQLGDYGVGGETGHGETRK